MPNLSGPNTPSGGGSAAYAAPSGRGYMAAPAAQPKNHAGFWLGVLIVLWTLALVAVIVLVMYLAGISIGNPFNYQKYKLQDVQTAFTNAGLEVSRPVTFTPASGSANQSFNFTFIEGESFIIPSAGPTGAGGILVFSSSGQLSQAKDNLADRAKNGNIPYYVYIKDNVVVFLNTPEAIAKNYERALNAMR